MAAPDTWAKVEALSREMKAFQDIYANMINSATAFVAAYNTLAADSSNTVITSQYRTWATTVTEQVSTFLSTTSAPPPP